MSLKKNKAFTLIKWIVMLAAYSFLVVKLARIEYWYELKQAFQEVNFARLLLLIFVIVLMPVNWLLEALKWQKLTEKSVSLSLKTALKSVLAGLSAGYITPNRIGDFVGRVLFLPKKHRLTGVVLSFVNSLTQNIVIAVFGLIGAIVYFSRFNSENNFTTFLFWTGIAFVLSLLLYFSFPKLVQRIKTHRLSLKIREILQSISEYKFWDLMVVISISSVRYVVFCLQYYLMLCFFGISVQLTQAVFAIPCFYLFVTFTPSLAVSEPAIRGSYAVLIFSVFSANTIGIMLTGILIWLINFVVPMLVGTVAVGRVKAN